jgi:DNA-binding NarL/FixJ family response regulator
MAEGPLVAVLADDLIWATRLDRLVRDAGGRPVAVRTLDALDRVLDGGRGDSQQPPAGVVVDLAGRAYDGIDAVRHAAARGAAVVAVGQHDDRAGREAARMAGASAVHVYGRLFAAGPMVLGTWIGELPGGRQ